MSTNQLTMDQIAELMPEIRKRARNITRCPHRGDDLAQDVFLRATRFAASYKGGNLRAWLTVMMKRMSFNAYKNSGKEVSIESLPGFDITADECASLQWDAERALETISRLSPAQSRALELALDGLSYDQIAEEMGCSTTTIRPRIHKARRRLEKELGYV